MRERGRKGGANEREKEKKEKEKKEVEKGGCEEEGGGGVKRERKFFIKRLDRRRLGLIQVFPRWERRKNLPKRHIKCMVC